MINTCSLINNFISCLGSSWWTSCLSSSVGSIRVIPVWLIVSSSLLTFPAGTISEASPGARSTFPSATCTSTSARTPTGSKSSSLLLEHPLPLLTLPPNIRLSLLSRLRAFRPNLPAPCHLRLSRGLTLAWCWMRWWCECHRWRVGRAWWGGTYSSWPMVPALIPTFARVPVPPLTPVPVLVSVPVQTYHTLLCSC